MDVSDDLKIENKGSQMGHTKKIKKLITEMFFF
jgi:hypothetical protein